MEPRGYFVIDIFLIAGLMFCFLTIGIILYQFLQNHGFNETVSYKVIIIFMVIICVIVNCKIPVSGFERPLFVCVQDERNGYLQRFHDLWKMIFEQAEKSEEQNVVIQSQKIPDPPALKNPDLSDDPGYWINIGAARYFGKETIAIEWIE